MKLHSFFKILNRKINMYDKLATNPFTDSRKLIIVWVEEPKNTNNIDKNRKNEAD